LELTEGGDFKVASPFNETSVKGIFAAGDCAGPMKAAALAAASGGVVVVGCYCAVACWGLMVMTGGREFIRQCEAASD
jgi:pyruvate/2-oxoglutarate dehydrogenase complex dihydrolipoamide dehydrogenase (E3) component